eukprot:CAMPEP_0206466476 /NCGR_PEP_ID=MMETSP0324_2-20121206/28478_1 /ASSEMBLY_ACC=CAM_ASM_000836 /TAXON_ID=2866 /ORGANISM="Crypthecodinium cohnii, Strain Seligo" /LENGTH=528 /DNA_ID=CAMNT_0053939593 /DNA_START=106 /DNA_END=1692 /DNA_ORIENTATION=-
MGETDAPSSPDYQAQAQFMLYVQQCQAMFGGTPGPAQGPYYYGTPTSMGADMQKLSQSFLEGEASCQLATPSTVESQTHEDYEEQAPEVDRAAAAAAPGAKGTGKTGRSARRRNGRKRDGDDWAAWGSDQARPTDLLKTVKMAQARGETFTVGFRPEGDWACSTSPVAQKPQGKDASGAKGKGQGKGGGKGGGKWSGTSKGSGSLNTTNQEPSGNCPLDELEGFRLSDLFEDQKYHDQILVATETIKAHKDRKLLHEAFLEWLLPRLVDLALHSSVTSRLVQAVIGSISTGACGRATQVLVPEMERLYASEHGNHVLTKVIEEVPDPLEYPFLEQIEKINPIKLARHRFGCRVLERLIEHGQAEKFREFGEIYAEQAAELCRHQFGNFVIQHLLEHGPDSLKPMIIEKMLPSIQQLATHRTASHVVQQALKCTWHTEDGAETNYRAEIWAGVVGDNDDQFREVAASRYGNYVVEELLQDNYRKDEILAKLKFMTEDQRSTPSFLRLKEAVKLADEPSESPKPAAAAAA